MANDIRVTPMVFDVVEDVVDEYCLSCPYNYLGAEDPCDGCRVRDLMDSLFPV